MSYTDQSAKNIRTGVFPKDTSVFLVYTDDILDDDCASIVRNVRTRLTGN